jgi:hypothetical protein
MSKKSGGGRKSKFQTSRNQIPKVASKVSNWTLWAFVSFYLETVMNPFGNSTMRIMTGFSEVSQLGWPTPPKGLEFGDAVMKVPWIGT